MKMPIREYSLFFRAFSNETKMLIIDELRKGPKNVTEIYTSLGFKQSRVSRALSSLIECRFVEKKTKGKEHIYSLNKDIEKLLRITQSHMSKCINSKKR